MFKIISRIFHPKPVKCNCYSMMRDDHGHVIHFDDCAVIQAALGMW